MSECIGILGVIIFLGIYTKFNNRSSILPKLICMSWLIQGLKLYLESESYKLNLVNSLLGMLIGTLLVVNMFDIFSLKFSGFFNHAKVIYNLIFFNYTYGQYNLDKLFDPTGSQTALYVCLNYFFIAINTFPLLSNIFVHKKLFNIPMTLYPSPIALSTLTIFLNYFRDTLPIHTNYVMVVDILCYIFLILNFVNDIVFLKVFTTEHVIFLVINILNLIFIHYFDIFGLNKSIGKFFI
jgi:hypothetical protein